MVTDHATVYFDPATGESGIDENYQTQVAAEQEYKTKAQADKEAAALKRAQINQLNKLTSIPASERKGHRISQLAVNMLPDIIAQVEANPNAFGPASDLNRYLPNMTPNVITEGVKNIQQGQRADAEQAARSAVIENASAIIKQLSGAAVSTQEATRIEGFLPAPNDNARTIINKLKEAQRTARLRLDSYAIEYPSLQGQSYQNPPSATTQEPSGSSGKTPVGDPIVLKNKTYQKYTDGTVEEL